MGFGVNSNAHAREPMALPFSFTLDREPVAKGRARSGQGRHYTPKATVDAEMMMRTAARRAGATELDGPVGLKVEFIFEPPASWPKYRREAAIAASAPKVTKPDTDNLAKLVKDALNGVAWADDAQVADLRVSKFYGRKPQTKVTIYRLV